MGGASGANVRSWIECPAIPPLFDTTMTTLQPMRAAVSTSMAAAPKA